jgi:predicted 2-oxoglutarate/Fe(II)-dependent dioxygenase YbiX/peroxiredoxin
MLEGYIQPGDAAPWWNQGRHKFIFDSADGRYIVVSFYGSACDTIGQRALRALHDNRRFVDDGKVRFFCVSTDPTARTASNIDEAYPSLQFVWDTDATVHRAYGVGSRMWIILNPLLRVVNVIQFSADGADIPQLLDFLEVLPPPSQYLGFEAPAPVLMLPNVFEPELCRHLIAGYEANGGRESGFMQEISGKAVELYDPNWKRRRDYIVTDGALIESIKARIARRVGIMMQKAFHFTFTRVERHLIACYSAEDGGHFGPHRDDTVKATEHRRFAVSINLNDGFEGGQVSFPEYSPRQFKAPIGSALVFSASLLHRVSRVTRGQRYVFLPFLYDEAAEAIRLSNQQFLSPSNRAATADGAAAT